MSLASILIWLAALSLVGLALLLWFRSDRGDQHQEMMLRLRALGADERAGSADYGSLEREKGGALLRAFNRTVARLGLDEIEPDKVRRLLLIAILAVPLCLISFGWFGGITVIAFSVAVAYAFLARKAAIRRAEILSQLPDFLEGVSRILAAGNTLEEALGQAARESPDPIRPLFLSIGRQVRLGAPIEEVLSEAAEVHGMRDLQVIALAANINRRFGGSLRSIFRSLVQAIRSRDAAQRELRALTAETRFSAMVLALIPIGLTLYILLQNPQYYNDMWADSGGRATLMFSVFLQVTGIFVIWRMMRSTEDPAA